MIIVLEPTGEYHEPKPYTHYAAIRVNVYVGYKIDEKNLVYHRCEDIQGLPAYDSERNAQLAAQSWLNIKVNRDQIIQDLIASIGE